MIKKLFILFFLISSVTSAQHTVKGVMTSKLDSDWLILYKIEGTKQVFINNTTIKKDSILVGNEKKEVGVFELQLPLSTKPGAYRATYRLEGAGFVDFFYNKENVIFIFNPDYPQETVSFTESFENKLYTEYRSKISKAQQKLDSIQIAVLQNPNLELKKEYQEAYSKLSTIQNTFEEKAKNKYIAPFIEANLRSNSPEILNSVENYMNNIKKTFFDKIDFSNKTLINSSFITNRILDFVLYINYSDDKIQQEKSHKQAINIVLSKINSSTYKRDIIQFLIEQFEGSKNLPIIDFLFEEHYNKLPMSLQDANFKSEKEALFAAEIGRIAPDFSWTSNGKNYKLSTLNDAENYILVFWSTSCSHCLREIPELHSYMKAKPKFKVIAFALEKDAFVWETYKKNNLYGWHNVLGLKKWENKTARTYQIHSTPSYFVLDKNKKIIAKPYDLKAVKEYFKN